MALSATSRRQQTYRNPNMIKSVLFFTLTLLATSAWAEEAVAPPHFALPLACTPGVDCFLQNYVDRDHSPQATDYHCGSQTYDGHKGSDFRLIDMNAMRQGVAVKAAADGVVRATRDGMEDRNIKETGAQAVANREAGNSVVIVHGDGWESQYAHMRKGSIAVKAGQSVKAGEVLGQVGLSGLTEFPHLHFEVRHQGATVDPFAADGNTACTNPGPTLWNPDTERQLAYRPAGLLKAGFAFAEPKLDNILESETPTALAPQSEALIFWAYSIGIRAGDTETFKLSCDDGKELINQSKVLPKNKATWLFYAGVRKPDDKCPVGSGFHADYRLLRLSASGETSEIVAISRAIAP